MLLVIRCCFLWNMLVTGQSVLSRESNMVGFCALIWAYMLRKSQVLGVDSGLEGRSLLTSLPCMTLVGTVSLIWRICVRWSWKISKSAKSVCQIHEAGYKFVQCCRVFLRLETFKCDWRRPINCLRYFVAYYLIAWSFNWLRWRGRLCSMLISCVV